MKDMKNDVSGLRAVPKQASVENPNLRFPDRQDAGCSPNPGLEFGVGKVSIPRYI